MVLTIGHSENEKTLTLQKYILAITTYNRLPYLKNLISSFQEYRSPLLNWRIVIADDGSDDGTLQYLEQLHIENLPLHIIRNHRKGIHHQFNTIVKYLESTSFALCFKCDDDIEFIKSGWETLYITAIAKSGFEHLCFFEQSWRPEKNLIPPVKQGPLISHCIAKDVQGAFFTLSPSIIQRVGYMDVEHFGYRGVGHIDYTLRACRQGFNNLDHPFDANGSNDYICYQSGNYKSSMPDVLISIFENDQDTQRKYALIMENRTYIPYKDILQPIDHEAERTLLFDHLNSLQSKWETQRKWYESELEKHKSELAMVKSWSHTEVEKIKAWYESLYGHLPTWYLKLGKIFKLRKKL